MPPHGFPGRVAHPPLPLEVKRAIAGASAPVAAVIGTCAVVVHANAGYLTRTCCACTLGAVAGSIPSVAIAGRGHAAPNLPAGGTDEATVERRHPWCSLSPR